MTESEQNNFIFRYLTDDRTNTALLLNGSWGSGKTFYIKNSLIPFLKNKNKKAIYISMYGIQNTEALSKAIFTESYFQKLNTKGGTISIGIAKTILKGITSFFNIDIDGGTNEIKKLSEFVNLKGKLLIIDDLERHDSSFNIVEILGFINNLCENDDVKVLLVCDENSLLKFGLSESDSEKYKSIKEKTIGDTIYFFPDISTTIPSIIDSFKLENSLGNERLILDKMLEASISNKILCHNFRAITRSCQKMSDIIQIVTPSYQKDPDVASFKDFLLHVFLGLTFFYLRFAKNSTLIYSENNPVFSSELGTWQYPLYKFAYDYCVNQKLKLDDFSIALSNFKRRKKVEDANENIKAIKSYYLLDDSKLDSCITNLYSDIQKNYVPPEEFTGLATYLIAIKHNLGLSRTDSLLELMISKVREGKPSKEIVDSLRVYSGYYLDSKEMVDNFQMFLGEMKSALDDNKEVHPDYISNSEQLSKLIENAKSNMESWMLDKKGFANHINFNALIDYISIPNCPLTDINAIRTLFLHLYTSIANISEFCSNDGNILEGIKKRVDGLLSQDFDNKKTRKLQFKWLSDDLNNCIRNIHRG